MLTKRHRHAAPLLAVAALATATLAGADTARADDKSLTLSLETYVDDATHRREQEIGGFDVGTDETEVGRGLVSGSISLAFMAPVTKALRIGVGARYLSNYRYQPDDDEDEDAAVLLGRMFELVGRGEYSITLGSAIALVPAVELGVPVLFASGELQEDLDSLERQGYSVNSLPRVGFLVGAELGVEYRLEDWFAVRPSVALLHERLFLISASVDGNPGADVGRSLAIMRIRMGASAVAYF